MRVLLIDDEPFILEIWGEIFRELGCEVVTGLNGQQGVAVLQAEPIDLIVTDIRMPGTDGFHVLNYLRDNEIQTPVFVCSGFFEEEQMALAAYKVEKLIKKPFDVETEINFFGDFIKSLN